MHTYDESRRNRGARAHRGIGRWGSAVAGALVGGLLLGAVAAGTDEPATAATAGAGADCPYSALWLEVVLSDRRLHVFDGDDRIDTHPVAVGQPGHETPTGEFEFTMVTWNPDWIPPDSEWAEDAEPKDPGEEGNPMGRAKILWNPPYYTVHGTNDEPSLGQAESHGSIRVSNPTVRELGELVMECGGAPRSTAWYQDTWDSPTDKREVGLSDPIPLVVRD